MAANFIMALRSDDAKFLDTHPLENHVLNVIARRARRTKCSRTGLEIGECFIGHKGLGLTEQQYRTVKKNLTKWNFCEFKRAGKSTDQGTIATLTNSMVYDINTDEANGRPTEDQRKTNGKPTTNNNVNNENNENNENKKTVPVFLLPDAIDKSIWQEFMKIRVRLKAINSDRAKSKLIKDLGKIYADTGENPDSVIERSIEKSWKGVFPNNGNNGYNGAQAAPTRRKDFPS